MSRPLGAAPVRAALLAAAGFSLAMVAGGAAPASPPPDQKSPPQEWCIAGVCLGRTGQEIADKYGAGRLDQMLVLGAAAARSERCYQARGKSVYVTAFFDDADPTQRITAVLLSGETVCPDAATARMGPDRAGCRGIRLFDPVEKLATVGAKERLPNEKGFPWAGSPADVSQFDYRCEPDDTCAPLASAFTRGGTIVAVSIWKPDC